jgi:hypothetical protein
VWVNFYTGKGIGRSRDGAVPLNMFFVASENPFPASFTLVVQHEGVFQKKKKKKNF